MHYSKQLKMHPFSLFVKLKINTLIKFFKPKKPLNLIGKIKVEETKPLKYNSITNHSTIKLNGEWLLVIYLNPATYILKPFLESL